MVLAISCVTPPPPVPQQLPSPPTPEPVRVPEGCERPLSGPWVHARDSRFHYLVIDDDGGTATLELEVSAPDAGRPRRHFGRDGGLPWLVPLDAGPVASVTRTRITVRRTPGGFVGSADDAGCLSFPIRVVACAEDHLELESPAVAAVPCDGATAALRREVLLRERGDAGPTRDDDAGLEAPYPAP